MELSHLLSRLGLPSPVIAVPFTREEDGTDYEVWKVTAGGETFVLKKAKEYELEVYNAFFREGVPGAPRLLSTIFTEAGAYFLMEFAEGRDLCRCTRETLILTLDALIALQKRYWGDKTTAGLSFEKSLQNRRNRGNYLNDEALERAYEEFLSEYAALPRTLCHDDLLPFNVRVAEDRATILDWEVAGILPYPTSLARLIAHGEEDDNAFFYMTKDDKAFAVDYYYEHLVQEKGISLQSYCRSLDLFLLYEYCEWIMLGNKYPDGDMARHRIYLHKAKEHIKRMESG